MVILAHRTYVPLYMGRSCFQCSSCVEESSYHALCRDNLSCPARYCSQVEKYTTTTPIARLQWEQHYTEDPMSAPDFVLPASLTSQEARLTDRGVLEGASVTL